MQIWSELLLKQSQCPVGSGYRSCIGSPGVNFDIFPGLPSGSRCSNRLPRDFLCIFNWSTASMALITLPGTLSSYWYPRLTAAGRGLKELLVFLQLNWQFGFLAWFFSKKNTEVFNDSETHASRYHPWFSFFCWSFFHAASLESLLFSIPLPP